MQTPSVKMLRLTTECLHWLHGFFWYQKLQYKTSSEVVSLLFPLLFLISEEGKEEETTRKLVIFAKYNQSVLSSAFSFKQFNLIVSMVPESQLMSCVEIQKATDKDQVLQRVIE